MAEMLYHVGDRVRIAAERNSERWDEDGEMEEWCGRVMTVVEVLDNCYFMEEDDGIWDWYPEMIAEIVLERPQVYKVGDRVTISLTTSGSGWARSMEVWLGSSMTISSVVDGGRYYHMEEDSGKRLWSPRMIAGLSSAHVPRQYGVGDRVQIVSQRSGSGWNPHGQMDVWLGEVMTIREVDLSGAYGTKYRMKEDINDYLGSGWTWSQHMIAGLEEEFIFEPATDDELMNLLS